MESLTPVKDLFPIAGPAAACLLALAFLSPAQQPASVSKVWVADRGDGTYKNPVLYADYSDPDAIRVGQDYYLTASSFNAVPGLPILHSSDLVNWEIIGHVFDQQPPFDLFRKPQHGNGAWAPAIRYHNGEFYVYWPDPDFGIYMAKAPSAAGPWSAPLLIKLAKGWIDPCPLWDDDGQAYLVNAMAGSRAGVKSILVVSRMSPDGARLLDSGTLVFDGHAEDATVEGPKFYKRNGYYYIFAPAGGVAGGWQLALRSKNVYGPYERKVVLAQAKSAINGPHQGAWVDTAGGQSWFLHFQDKGAYGRILHLEPMEWRDDWPVIGAAGEPVSTYRKPEVGRAYPIRTPADSDEFNADSLGLQWQWHANQQPGWAFPAGRLGFLRLICVPLPEVLRNFCDVPNLLLQKFPAPEFTATAKVTFTATANGETTGLIVMGTDYAYLSLVREADGLHIVERAARNADRGEREKENETRAVPGATFYLRVKVSDGAVCRFSYSANGKDFLPAGEPFTARPGRWIGAKVGLFALRNAPGGEYGYADYDWFRVSEPRQ